MLPNNRNFDFATAARHIYGFMVGRKASCSQIWLARTRLTTEVQYDQSGISLGFRVNFQDESIDGLLFGDACHTSADARLQTICTAVYTLFGIAGGRFASITEIG